MSETTEDLDRLFENQRLMAEVSANEAKRQHKERLRNSYADAFEKVAQSLIPMVVFNPDAKAAGETMGLIFKMQMQAITMRVTGEFLP